MKIRTAMIYFLSAVTSLIMVACTTMPGMPGFISESTSEFDRSKQIKMEPAWLPNSLIKLALFKNTKMTENEVILTVVVKGAHSFSKGISLHFNIDGNIINFKSMDLLTDINTKSGFAGSGIYIPPSNWSSKDYLVTKDFVRRIIEANRVVVKVDLRKSFMEGIFSHDAPTLARPAFKSFYQKMGTLEMIL